MLLPLLALIAGILAAPFLAPHPVWLCFPLAVLLALAKRPFALLAVFLLGAGRGGLEQPLPSPPPEGAIRLEGVLQGPPDWRGLGVYLDLQTAAFGRVRLTEFLEDAELKNIFDALDLGSGDRVEMLVALRRPNVYRDPGVFDYRAYLESQGIRWTGTIRNPRLITVLERGWHGPDRLRRWIAGRLEQHFSSDGETAGLVLGMVLGKKNGLTPATERLFQRGGLYHLVVVSGFNLAVVAAVAGWAARRLTRKRTRRLLLTLISAIGFAGIVGWQLPVVRATLMVSVLLSTKLMDRDYAPLRAAALSAFILLVLQPRELEDSSFQMTFAAVITVVGLGGPASRWIFGRLELGLLNLGDATKDGNFPPEVADWRVAQRMWCELRRLPVWLVTIPWRMVLFAGEALATSIWVESVFTYFMVESFHRISPVAPFVNVPAGLIAAALTPLGLLLMVLPGIAAVPIAWIMDQLIHLLIWLLQVSLALPGATVRVPSAPLPLWIAYGIVLAGAALSTWRKRFFWCSGCWVGIVGLQTVMVLADFSPPPPKDLTLTFLDVGQGDSILAEFPDGRRILVDGGGVAAGRFLGLRDESTFSIGEDVVSAYLFSRRIRQLDSVVLTHAHHDHMDGLFDVLENFPVGDLWLGKNSMVPAYKALLQLASERAVPIRWVSKGQQIAGISILHPPADWKVRKAADNNDSVVLLLESGGQTALLTGDLELVIPVPEFVTVFKVPHHGSRNGRLRIRSDVRVISVGANNPFGHPHPSSLPALRTDRLGAIRVALSSPRPKVESTER